MNHLDTHLANEQGLGILFDRLFVSLLEVLGNSRWETVFFKLMLDWV